MRADGVSADLELTNEKGLHTRTSTVFVKLAIGFASNVRVTAGDRTVDGKSVIELLTLGAGRGTRLTIRASGPDQDTALRELRALVEDGFPGAENERADHS